MTVVDIRLFLTECGARYKTRPGLSYHVNHSHSNAKKKDTPQLREREKEREQSRENSRESRDFQPQVLQFDEEPVSPNMDDSLNGS